METLTRREIVAGLKELGLNAGDKVLVHSSLAALGKVEGGADTVIEALIEAVGPEGLVVAPTFDCAPPFDRRTSLTPLGAMADSFWRRPDAFRSLHPTHSVAAIGRGAEELVRDHEKAATAYTEGTPYYTLARQGGKVLLLGVDQDRNTTLHAAEAIAEAPYLDTVEDTYIDDEGKEVTISIPWMAGPHRNFLGLDPMFRERGFMRIGRVGKAVCRLMDAWPMIEATVEAIRKDPAAVLCDNPACEDCVMQRGRIKAARLAQEEFTLAAVADDVSDDPQEIIDALKGEGIGSVEMTARQYLSYGDDLENAGLRIAAIQGAPDDEKGAQVAARLGVPLIVPVSTHGDFDAGLQLAQSSGANVLIVNDGAPSSFYDELYTASPDAPGFAFNPGQFAAAGEKPFLEVFYAGTTRKHLQHFYIDDGTFDGEPTLPGLGNGEVKEIISMLRCRSYNGIMTLRSHQDGTWTFRAAAAAFWRLMETM